MLCCTQPQSRAQTCLPFRPGPLAEQQMSAHWRQVLPRMASTAIADAICGENSAMISDFKSSVHILNLLHMYNVLVHGSSISGNQKFKALPGGATAAQWRILP